MQQPETNNVVIAEDQTNPSMIEIMAELAAYKAKEAKEAGTQPSTATPDHEVTSPDVSNVPEPTQEIKQPVEQEDLAAPRVSGSVATPTTTNADPVKVHATGIIDIARKERIVERVMTVLNDPRFWEVESRVERLEDAAVIPMFDDRAMQMFYNYSVPELKAKAAEESFRTGRPAVMPTEEDIIKDVYRKKAEKDAKDAAKLARKLSRDAKKL